MIGQYWLSLICQYLLRPVPLTMTNDLMVKGDKLYCWVNVQLPTAISREKCIIKIIKIMIISPGSFCEQNCDDLENWQICKRKLSQ